MSESSYQVNVTRGVTGPRTGTCYMASLDRISHTAGVRTETYEQYDLLRDLWVEEVGDGGNYIPDSVKQRSREVMQKAWSELDMPMGRQKELRATSVTELGTMLAKLTSGGFRSVVYLDTGGLHAVGVVPLDDEYYLTKSTWSPFGNEPASVSDLFLLLDQPPRERTRQHSSRKTNKLSNIIAIPPESPTARPPLPHA